MLSPLLLLSLLPLLLPHHQSEEGPSRPMALMTKRQRRNGPWRRNPAHVAEQSNAKRKRNGRKSTPNNFEHTCLYNNKLLRISDIYSKTKSIIYATIDTGTLASYVEHSLLHAATLTCVKFLATIVEIRYKSCCR